MKETPRKQLDAEEERLLRRVGYKGPAGLCRCLRFCGTVLVYAAFYPSINVNGTQHQGPGSRLISAATMVEAGIVVDPAHPHRTPPERDRLI